ncbi:MAG: UvrB/UvrC motif-containing protein [candidate division KSB1 bacterium]|nr:UvrB/UvrC motif-containing protein [candidate division KSB1 bacterium]MDZ7340620.1 UvrB/UvrC motif-containing protein [candidate division KSB1 bacterium]
MMCEICGIREASIKFTQIINTKKKELHLCKTCAEEKGYTDPLAAFPKLIGGFILGILGEAPSVDKSDDLQLSCRKCQLSWQEFKKTGLLGCSECYDSFSNPLKDLLRKLHGSNKHIGNRPPTRRVVGSDDELERLQRELKHAIRSENYEYAAQLRDRIRDIEAQVR